MSSGGWLVTTKYKVGSAGYRAAVNTLSGMLAYLPTKNFVPAFVEFGSNFEYVWTNARNCVLSDPFGELAGTLSLPCKVFDLPVLNVGDGTNLCCMMDALAAAPNDLLMVSELSAEECERMTGCF